MYIKSNSLLADEPLVLPKSPTPEPPREQTPEGKPFIT